MTTEQKLQAIIDAQNNQGSGNWWLEDWTPDFDDGAIIVHQDMGKEDQYGYDLPPNHIRVSILEILLDTNGLKAAYGEEFDQRPRVNENGEMTFRKVNGEYVSHKILDAWHSGEGNNVDAAIDVAYNLL